MSFALTLIALLALNACLLDPERGSERRVWDGTPGFVHLDVGLARNQDHGLAKMSIEDSTFGLDSLIIVLTAAGADTLTYRYAISGRPDTGTIAVAPKIYTLNPLLNWKARFYSIDTTMNPVRRDTVHFDSIIFAIKPADTAYVAKTVAAAFSMLRARFLSKASSMDSVGTSIQFLRLKVGGITRDSVPLYGSTNRAVWFASRSTGWIVQDSGRVLKTTDSGYSWYRQNISSTTNLRAVSFPTTTTGWVAGENGLLKKTSDGGATWETQSIAGSTRAINALRFTSVTDGFAVLDSGWIYRTTDGGDYWWLLSGGWFESKNTSGDLTDVSFADATTGFAVNGTSLRLTTNGGMSWLAVGPFGQPLNGIRLYSSTSGYLVGDQGYLMRYDGSLFTSRASATTRNLRGLHVRGSDSAWAVGDSETVVRNTAAGGSGWASVPSGWETRTATPAGNSWYGVSFGSSTTGYMVGAGGNIRRTTDGGATWNTVTISGTAQTSRLRAVFAFSATHAMAVGDGGWVARTTNGTTWNWVASGAGNVSLNSVAMASSTLGWAVGASNNILGTDNTGSSWTARAQPGTWNAAAYMNSRAWVAGNGGVMRRTDQSPGRNTQFNRLVSTTAIGTTHIYGIAFPASSSNTDTCFVVGDSGLVARSVNVTNSNAAGITWTILPKPATVSLAGAYFITGKTGWVTGVNGTVWRTTDAGNSWTAQYHGNATDSLRGIWATHADTAYYVGSSGAIRSTVTGGELISGKSAPQRLTDVFFPTSTVGYIVGSNGTISQTTDAGLRWTSQDNSDPDTLNSVHFISADTGWAVGNTGTILKTVNGGTNWDPQNSGVSDDLTRVRFINSQRGWVTTASGKMLRTTDGGANWAVQNSGTTQRLTGLHVFDFDTVYAVGTGGVVRKTVSAGNVYTTSQNLKALAVNGTTVYTVGSGGAAYRSNNRGRSWKTLTGATDNFNGVFATANFGYMVADGGVVKQIFKAEDSTTLNTKVSGTTRNLRAISGSPSETATTVIVAGDSGTVGRFASYAAGVSLDTGSFYEDFQGLHCTADATDCLLVGSRESILRNTAPLTNGWALMSLGARRFDYTLSSKYLRTGVADTVILQAIDRVSPLRGYQKILSISIGAGQDSTLETRLTKCGYGGPVCVP